MKSWVWPQSQQLQTNNYFTERIYILLHFGYSSHHQYQSKYIVFIKQCLMYVLHTQIPIVIIEFVTEFVLEIFAFNYIVQACRKFYLLNCCQTANNICCTLHIAHNWTILVERKMRDKFVALNFFLSRNKSFWWYFLSRIKSH